MPRDLHVVRSAGKQPEQQPEQDRVRLLTALQSMREDPFTGDVARLHGQPTAWRRRIGNWRILYDLYPERQLIIVGAVSHRTSTGC